MTATEAVRRARERLQQQAVDAEKKASLPCLFGTPWLDHFDPPIGTGKGCKACDDFTESDEA